MIEQQDVETWEDIGRLLRERSIVTRGVARVLWCMARGHNRLHSSVGMARRTVDSTVPTGIVVGATSTTPAAGTVALIVRSVQRRVAASAIMPAAMATCGKSARTNRHRVALDHSTVSKASWIHSIVGREAPADIEGNQSSLFPGQSLTVLVPGRLVFPIVDSNDTGVSLRVTPHLVSGFRPMSSLAKTCVRQ
jgi:hypothetical protein